MSQKKTKPERKMSGQIAVTANTDGQVVLTAPVRGFICFTPEQARHLATSLIEKAEVAEAYERRWA